jgi:hypothetical protein
MTEIALVGGFSSSPDQYQYLAAKLQDYYGVVTTGINFSTARAYPERLADLIDRQKVVAHSAGLLAVAEAMKLGAVPDHITSIAPPIPELVRKLVWRGALIGHSDPATQEQMEAKMAGFSSKEELAHHPVRNFGSLPALGHFASLEFATWAERQGSDVEVAFMQNDGLFNLRNIRQASVDQAVHAGVTVKRLDGTHTRFTANPTVVLDEIQAAPIFTLEEIAEATKESLRERMLRPIGAFGTFATGLLVHE